MLVPLTARSTISGKANNPTTTGPKLKPFQMGSSTLCTKGSIKASVASPPRPGRTPTTNPIAPPTRRKPKAGQARTWTNLLIKASITLRYNYLFKIALTRERTSGGCTITSRAKACNSSPVEGAIISFPLFASAISLGSFMAEA